MSVANRLKEQLEKLKRNQERRLARKNQKLGIAPGQMGLGGKKAVKTETTRVCGNCGQRGHMKTSRKLCPRWAEFNQVRLVRYLQEQRDLRARPANRFFLSSSRCQIM